jgi:predicted acyltransferase
VVFLKTGWRTQAWLMGGLLVLYYVLMCFVPVPGVGFANLQPTTNLAAWVDNHLLAGHLWRTSKVWDPEGVLSTLPAIATGLSGVLTGGWIRREEAPAEKVTWMFVLRQRRPGGRPGLELRLPDQQVAVDEFVRALHVGAGP